MSKVEKNGSVEVKVVKTEDEGGEFHTQQVGIFLFISKGFSDTVIHIQGNKKKKQQGGRSRNNSAGDKKYEKDRGRFGKTLVPKTSNTL